MELEYNSDHQVLVCKFCQTCVMPSRKSIEKHLRSQPHRLTGQTLKSHLEYTDSLKLRSLECL
jgi:predicted metal-binding protein